MKEKKEKEGKLDDEINDERKGSICSPNSGSCTGFTRLVPITLIDVAGLVPGAHEGRGRGNQFLSDLARCDALIQIVDTSGTVLKNTKASGYSGDVNLTLPACTAGDTVTVVCEWIKIYD